MITNATLIAYTTPAVSNGRGGRAGGEVVAYAAERCSVDRPKRSLREGGGGKLADVTAVLFAPRGLTPPPALDGRITFRRDHGTADETLQVAEITPHDHGDQSHFEILLRPVR